LAAVAAVFCILGAIIIANVPVGHKQDAYQVRLLADAIHGDWRFQDVAVVKVAFRFLIFNERSVVGSVTNQNDLDDLQKLVAPYSLARLPLRARVDGIPRSSEVKWKAGPDESDLQRWEQQASEGKK